MWVSAGNMHQVQSLVYVVQPHFNYWMQRDKHCYSSLYAFQSKPGTKLIEMCNLCQCNHTSAAFHLAFTHMASALYKHFIRATVFPNTLCENAHQQIYAYLQWYSASVIQSIFTLNITVCIDVSLIGIN